MLATICILDPNMVKWLLYSRVKMKMDKPVVEPLQHKINESVDISDTFLQRFTSFNPSYYSNFVKIENENNRKVWVMETYFGETEVH